MDFFVGKCKLILYWGTAS